MTFAKSKKGIALPLETVVLLILAAVVLGALLAFFLGIFTPTDIETKRIQQQINICNEIFSKDPLCKSDAAKSVAQSKLIDGNNPAKIVVCKAEIPGCNPIGTRDSDAANCIATCCGTFCPAG